MLRRWLGGDSIEAFVAGQLGAEAWARPSVGGLDRGALDWYGLERLLAARDPAPDTLVVSRGARLPVRAPNDLRELVAMFEAGIGVAMRRTERCVPELRAVAQAFARDLPGVVHVQVFATPAGTHGFGWHYDDEDVFILQTEGVKDYYFRANTVMPEVSASDARFDRFYDEASPLQTARLEPGDVLYLPARWWHMAICREDALSISVGVRPYHGFVSLARTLHRVRSTLLLGA